jgi:glycolate oxidase iron-sulfur subunit
MSAPASAPNQALRIVGGAPFETGVHYEHFLDCVHCGLCTSACPTYLELGTEMDGPRGRIYLMKAVADGRLPLSPELERHIDLCLDCRACETACPSGVQYGRLIEPFRASLEHRRREERGSSWFDRWILFPLFPYANRMRWALWPARIAQKLKLDVFFLDVLRLDRFLPKSLQQMARMLPHLQYSPSLPTFLPAKGSKRATVALATGCVADAVFRHVHWATARVLQENGCNVHIPSGQGCCGAIHYHAGAEGPAIEAAAKNAAVFDLDAMDAVIVNVAGCGAMMKDYPHLHLPTDKRATVERLAAKTMDVSEFLCKLGPIPTNGRIEMTAVYHDACHLAHAQQIRQQPRDLLAMIPGLKVAPIAEADICCGAAGTYNLTEPEMADRLAKRKTDAILDANPDILLTPNAGCHLHIGRKLRERGRRFWVGHPIELLDFSYRGLQPPRS